MFTPKCCRKIAHNPIISCWRWSLKWSDRIIRVDPDWRIQRWYR